MLHDVVKSMSKTTLILGGGIGGIVAANSLKKKVGKDHRLMVVDKTAAFHFPPSFLWIMMGRRSPSQITRSLGALSGKGITFVRGSVSKIDPGNRLVKVDGKDYGYDYLVVAVGADLRPEVITGLGKVAHHFYQLDAAERAREALRSFSEGILAIGVARTPFKCPSAPIEAAFLIEDRLREAGVRDRVTIRYFSVEPQPMPTAGPKFGSLLREMLSKRGIEYYPNQKLMQVDAQKRELFFEKGETMKFDLLLTIPPHVAPTAVKESGLTGEKGWIPAHARTLRTKYNDVYAIGDVAAIKLPSGGMLPKAGVFAERQAQIVAHNIASEVKGAGERKGWDGRGSCFIETEHGKAGYASGEFYTEPRPKVILQGPGRVWHWAKVLFEKYWLWRQF